MNRAEGRCYTTGMSIPTHYLARQITAVILAGGASSRMQGQPKALLSWRGRRFIDHIIDALRPQAATLAISTSQSELFADLPLPVLADPFPERRGPLAGMLAGLAFSETPLTLFAPCDNPMLPPHLGARLFDALQSRRADIAYASTGTDQHYLYALMRSDLHVELRKYFVHEDYSVHRWFATQTTVTVAFDDQVDCFLNINTPEALLRLNHIAHC